MGMTDPFMTPFAGAGPGAGTFAELELAELRPPARTVVAMYKSARRSPSSGRVLNASSSGNVQSSAAQEEAKQHSRAASGSWRWLLPFHVEPSVMYNPVRRVVLALLNRMYIADLFSSDAEAALGAFDELPSCILAPSQLDADVHKYRGGQGDFKWSDVASVRKETGSLMGGQSPD